MRNVLFLLTGILTQGGEGGREGDGCGVTCGTRHTLGGAGQHPDITQLLLLCHTLMQHV